MTRRRYVSKRLVSESSILSNDVCLEVLVCFTQSISPIRALVIAFVAPPLKAVDPAAEIDRYFNSLPTATSPERSEWYCKNNC